MRVVGGLAIQGPAQVGESRRSKIKGEDGALVHRG